jgi:alpha-1,3-rhamnosyl/mannosyltransferase
MRRVARRAARVIAPSEAARDEVAAAVEIDRAKIATIPLFVDEMASWIARVRAGSCEVISERVRALPRFVLYTGHHLPHKDVPLVVGAVARVKKELGLRELALALAGPRGRGTPAVEAAARDAGVAEHVHLLGEVVDRDLAFLYAASRGEGFGLALAEAAFAGAPCIASDIAAHRETLGDAALFFEPGDEKALAGALARVLSIDALARDLGARGTARARRFSALATARATADVYRAVLGIPAARAAVREGAPP